MKMHVTVASTRQPDYSSEPYRDSRHNVHDTISDLMTRVSQLDIATGGKAAAATNDNAAIAARDSPPTNEDARREERNNNYIVADGDVEEIEEKLSSLNFNITPDVAGAKNFNITPDVAGAKNFNITPDVAGAKIFNITPDVAGAKNFNITLAGAKNFNITPDVVGAKNFNITPEVASAKNEVLTREHPDDQDGSGRVQDEYKASDKDEDEDKDKVIDVKFCGNQVELQKAVHSEDTVTDAGDEVSAVKDKGSYVWDKVEDAGKTKGKIEDVEKVKGKVEDLGKVKGEVEDVGKVKGKVEDVGKVQGKVEDAGKAKGKVEDLEKVKGKVEDVGKVKGKVEDVGKVQGEVEDVGKAKGKVEDLEKVQGKVGDAMVDAGKGKVAEIEIRDEVQDKDGQVSSGGNLLPRSPMRPEHVPSRSVPYHVTSRNRNHCAGGYVVGERAFEPITQLVRSSERDCFSSVNILPFNITSGTHTTSGPPAFPFVSSTSFPEDFPEDPFSPQDFAAEVVYKAGSYNVNEIVQLVTSVRNPEIFERVCEDFGFRQNVLDLPSDIPQSVLDYDCDATTTATTGALACTADNYREIPSVSSGYHSSSSPRSTSPQSPGASRERFADNCSPLDNDNVEWHGTTSEFYGQPDAVFDSGLLKNLDLDAYDVAFGGGGGGGTATCDPEVYQPVSGYDEIASGDGSSIATSFTPVATAAFDVFASSYAPQSRCGQPSDFSPNQPNVTALQPNLSPARTDLNAAPIQLDLTELRPNITQFQPDITLLLPPVTQLECRAGGGASPATSAAPLRIQPKPSLNSESATQRLLKRLDKNKKSKIWAKISTINDEDLTKGDLDGDTQLMILLLQESLSQDGCMLEYVYALVERLKLIPGELTTVNNQQQSVLYLAALHCPDPDSALIARYIAEAMIETQTSVDMVYNDGDTLLHCLCREGAKRFEALRELLSLKDAADKPYFDTDKYNDRGMTPLLEAVSCHGQADSVRSVRLLIDAGADTTLTTNAPCHTDALRLAIATACDPALVAALLADRRLAAACAAHRYGEATALHCAARRNDLPPERQRRVMAALVEGGARRDARDKDGRLPAELLSGERREAFKQMGNKR